MGKIKVTQRQLTELGEKLEHLCTLSSVASIMEDAHSKTEQMNSILDSATTQCDELNESIKNMFEVVDDESR